MSAATHTRTARQPFAARTGASSRGKQAPAAEKADATDLRWGGVGWGWMGWDGVGWDGAGEGVGGGGV